MTATYPASPPTNAGSSSRTLPTWKESLATALTTSPVGISSPIAGPVRVTWWPTSRVLVNAPWSQPPTSAACPALVATALNSPRATIASANQSSSVETPSSSPTSSAWPRRSGTAAPARDTAEVRRQAVSRVRHAPRPVHRRNAVGERREG